MKKILSLLSMLMITVTAFATSYTDQLNYKLTVFTALTKNLPAGELTVEPYGTSNYTVTAKGCDFLNLMQVTGTKSFARTLQVQQTQMVLPQSHWITLMLSVHQTIPLLQTLSSLLSLTAQRLMLISRAR